jgi:N-methylhydantoinase A
VLGYLNPRHLVGGALRLAADKARAVLEARIARPLGLGVEEAAYGAYRIAASNMIRAIKAVSSERGRDPRQYALVAFGGNGPLFAAAMAEALAIGRILIPPAAGVFSSLGLLCAEVEYHFSQTRKGLLPEIDPAALEGILGELERAAHRRLRADGFPSDRIVLQRSAALHYQGQSFELEVPVPDGTIDQRALAGLAAAYDSEHERTYGHRAGAGEPVELVTLKLVGRGIGDPPRAALSLSKGATHADLSQSVAIAEPVRRAYFGAAGSWREARVLNRADLGMPSPGPCIIEEYDSTCLVPPGAVARLDRLGNIEIMMPKTDTITC